MLGNVQRRSRLLVVSLVLLVPLIPVLAFIASQGGATGSPSASQLHPVAGDFVPDDTELHRCGDQPCFRQALGNVAFRSGPKAALELLHEVYADGSTPACHTAAHTIGAATLARYEGDVARTFAEGSAICWSGYYHGVLEYSLKEVRSHEASKLAAVARELCRDALATMSPWIAYQCLHGLGHGLMITTGLRLPLALDVCKRLATRWDRDACKGGVFMENFAPTIGQSKWLRADDPVYPCSVVAREDKWRCYQMVTSRILPLVRDDWSATAKTCAAVEQDFVAVCFASFGRDVSSRSDRDREKIVRLCEIARPYGGEDNCILAAAWDATANHMSGTKGAMLCTVVRPALRSDCYFGVGAVMGRFRRSHGARARDCRSLTHVRSYVDACLRGGMSTLPRTEG